MLEDLYCDYKCLYLFNFMNFFIFDQNILKRCLKVKSKIFIYFKTSFIICLYIKIKLIQVIKKLCKFLN